MTIGSKKIEENLNVYSNKLKMNKTDYINMRSEILQNI